VSDRYACAPVELPAEEGGCAVARAGSGVGRNFWLLSLSALAATVFGRRRLRVKENGTC
jgi:hypothetical protein